MCTKKLRWRCLIRDGTSARHSSRSIGTLGTAHRQIDRPEWARATGIWHPDPPLQGYMPVDVNRFDGVIPVHMLLAQRTARSPVGGLGKSGARTKAESGHSWLATWPPVQPVAQSRRHVPGSNSIRERSSDTV